MSYKVYDGTATGTEKDDLFKLSVSASADAGGSFAIYSESKKAIETDLININATSFKIKGSFLAGGCIQVTVPTRISNGCGRRKFLWQIHWTNYKEI